MKKALTLTVALAATAFAVPVAGAEPDSYQPQLRGADSSDVVSRALDNRSAPSDVVDRAIRRRQQESSVPLDSFDRAPLADRPVTALPAAAGPSVDSSDGVGGIGLVGALALAATLGAAATALTPRKRKSLAHR